MSQIPSDPHTPIAAAGSVAPATIGAPPAGDPATPGPHAAPGDVEEVYFEGSPPARGNSGRIALFGLIGIFFIALAVFLIYKKSGPWWLTASAFLLGIFLPTVPIAMAKNVRYRISNYRIDYERGMLSKNIDTMELWHVEDLHFHQSLMDRLLNVGTITVIAKDDVMPRLEIRGIPRPRPLYDMLKQRVIAVKRQRGVIKMDPG
jgi:membrane protein YdbS with pleckstrin-like domain